VRVDDESHARVGAVRRGGIRNAHTVGIATIARTPCGIVTTGGFMSLTVILVIVVLVLLLGGGGYYWRR
jgi:hypothetical protein